MGICQRMRDHLRATKIRLRDWNRPYYFRLKVAQQDLSTACEICREWCRYYTFLRNCVIKYEDQCSPIMHPMELRVRAVYTGSFWTWAQTLPETAKQLRAGRSRRAILYEFLCIRGQQEITRRTLARLRGQLNE